MFTNVAVTVLFNVSQRTEEVSKPQSCLHFLLCIELDILGYLKNPIYYFENDRDKLDKIFKESSNPTKYL